VHVRGSSSYIDASRWCITREDLDLFESEVRELWLEGKIPDDPDHPNRSHDDPSVGPTIFQVSKHYIEPTTRKAGGVSWALMRNPDGLECDVFATHCWAEGIFEFTTKVRQAWPRDAKHLWCCFLSNPQAGGVVKEVLEGDILQTPFARALLGAKYLLVIPNKQQCVFSRLWCVFEFHLAVRAGLSIRLPMRVPWGRLAAYVALGLALFTGSACLSFFTWASSVEVLFGPFMWLFVAFAASSLLDLALRHRAVLSGSWLALRLLQVFLIGQGVGLSVHHSLGLTHGNRFAGTLGHDYELGTGWASCKLAATFVLYYLRKIGDVFSSAAIAREGFELDFRTVADATCTDAHDEERIRREISGKEAEIDRAINTLRVVGRYDRTVQANIDSGVPATRMREGIDPFQVVCACCAWQYWWTCDLRAHELAVVSVETSAITWLLALSFVYLIGEHAIFAVDTVLWGGLLFVLGSVVHIRVSGTEAMEVGGMTSATLHYQIACLSAVLLANALHYRGRPWPRPKAAVAPWRGAGEDFNDYSSDEEYN